MFQLFDQNEEFFIQQGKLPHWFQPGVTYFITFRTADSVPAELSRAWHVRRDQWLRHNGIEPISPDWFLQIQTNPKLQREYDLTFTREFMEYLDRGLGECPLRNERVAEIIAGALRFFDGERYWLGDFVVMPNHVHLLVCLIGATNLEKQCHSWKSFSGARSTALSSERDDSGKKKVLIIWCGVLNNFNICDAISLKIQ